MGETEKGKQQYESVIKLSIEEKNMGNRGHMFPLNTNTDMKETIRQRKYFY